MTHDAVPPDQLRAALAGELPDAERLAVLDRAARTPEGRRELELMRVSVVASREAFAETRRASSWAPLAAAAAVMLMAGAGVWWRTTQRAADPMRSVDAAAGVTLVSATAATLTWHRVPNAVRYDVELLATDGRVLHSGSTTDTTLDRPAVAAAEWWVQARLADGTTRRSSTAPLSAR